MSDDKKSLFNQHLELLGEKGEGELNAELRVKKEEIENLRLPPLELPEKVSFWQQIWQRPQALGFALVCCFALLFFFPQGEKDRLFPKGAMKVSVFWERDGVVADLTAETNLQNGDKVGATVIGLQEGFAYWGVVDNDLNLLSETQQFVESQIKLLPGVSESFKSSFTLVEPNQGESLVVIVCSKEREVSQYLDREFLAKILAEKSVEAKNCVFVGFRLRKLGEQ